MSSCAQPSRNLPEQLHLSFFGQQIARSSKHLAEYTAARKCFELVRPTPNTRWTAVAFMQPLGYRVILDSRLIALS